VTTLRLALRNLLGAGMRTWLNAIALSFSFVAIIYTQGLLDGSYRQAEDAMVQSDIAGGQYWQQAYDPYDPLSLPDAHAALPPAFEELVRQGRAMPILISQGTIYPAGRARQVLLKGIAPDQQITALPSRFLAESTSSEIPALIGGLMAQSTGLKTGDRFTIQWRDAHGTFDAREARIVQVMTTIVPTIDEGQIWLPLARLQEMIAVPGQATLVTVARDLKNPPAVAGWALRDQRYLLKDIRTIIQSKSISSSIVYVLLMLLAMLAIFDTQVLSIFRRRREMGTLMALGMTRGAVIRLFTLEGALIGALAAVTAAAYGLPLLVYSARTGLGMPKVTSSMGYAIGERIFPAYGAGLVVGTTVLVLLVTTIVSYMPTRRIAKLKPTDALRGRWS
jgi:putative ABC transport system permease protein